jgi:hypothetical protein
MMDAGRASVLLQPALIDLFPSLPAKKSFGD